MSKDSTFDAAPRSVARGAVLDRAVAVGALALLGALAIVGPAAWTLKCSIAALAVALAFASSRVARDAARSVSALVAALCVAWLMPLPWQAAMAVALLGYTMAARRVRAVAPSSAWRAKGAWCWPWALAVGGVTPVALLGWVALMRPDLSGVRSMVPAVSPVLLVVGGVAFSFVNATLEELVWRGALQDRLRALFSAPVAVLVQAVSFGVMHAHGVPRGPMGVVLAGVWAIMLGALRERSRGLAAPIVAHVVADAVIAVIILGRIGA